MGTPAVDKLLLFFILTVIIFSFMQLYILGTSMENSKEMGTSFACNAALRCLSIIPSDDSLTDFDESSCQIAQWVPPEIPQPMT